MNLKLHRLGIRIFIPALVFAWLTVQPAAGASSLGIIDWDTNNPIWTSDNPNVTAATTVGGDQWLQLTFSSGTTPEGTLVSGDAADLFAGTWSSESWVEFDFWADAVVPQTLQIRWGAGTNVWGNDVSPSPTGGGSWQGLRSDTFSNVADWDVGLGDPNAFLADLSSIDWIGVYIYQDVASDAVYGVDDMQLMVPEPAEWMMLAAAFGVIVLIVRRRRPVPVA